MSHGRAEIGPTQRLVLAVEESLPRCAVERPPDGTFEGGHWQDVTTTLNTETNRVCGQVSSLSPFAIFERSFTFNGFLAPIDNLPTRNTVKAGASVPVKFNLNGDQGLNILAVGSPSSQAVVCTGGTSTDPIEQTVTAGASGLTYDPSTGTYSYVWKTEKSWANSCRRLSLKLIDGSVHVDEFGFAK